MISRIIKVEVGDETEGNTKRANLVIHDMITLELTLSVLDMIIV